MLGRFNYFNNCLLNAKEAVRQSGYPDFDYIEQNGEEVIKKTISRCKEYKLVIKCEAEALRALKYTIREIDRQIRSNSI